MMSKLARLEDIIAIVALILFTGFIIANVFFRYVLNAPLSWPEEASLIAFSWLLFVGAAICAREQSHIFIDVISPDPSGTFGRALEILAPAVGAVVAAVMAYVCFRYTIGSAPMMTPIFRISSAVYNAAAPVGFALITLHLAHRTVESVTGQRRDGAPGRGL